MSRSSMEGWNVADSYGTDNPGPEGYEKRIERVDVPEHGDPKFANDEEAWNHVVKRAREGSMYHREALEEISEHERQRIISACGNW